jgi:hypothetical protein
MCVAGRREHAGDQHIIDRRRLGLGAAGSWCIRFSASLTAWVSALPWHHEGGGGCGHGGEGSCSGGRCTGR